MLIAQVTDTHIKAAGKLAYRMVDSAAKLGNCVAHLNRLDPRPDFVLLTGDLVDLGRAEEYALLREILAPLRMPLYVIPGNHDERAALREAFADHAYLPRDGEFLHYVLEDYPVRLIGLDTTVPGKQYGALCDERMAWLAEQLARAPSRTTVLFMHHPPFLTGLANMDWQNCRNGDALGALVRRHPQVIRILCGHVHRPIHLQWCGVTASIAPSPSHSCVLDLNRDASHDFVLEPPTCELHYWREDTGLVSHLSFIGDYGGRFPFYDAAGKLID
ncbi:MAG TPA: phosphodiesterase [Solirubrobacteraceae bacterium]|nr:phosphodiesterase [Solirubrobacteraceae bacterium]